MVYLKYYNFDNKKVYKKLIVLSPRKKYLF